MKTIFSHILVVGFIFSGCSLMKEMFPPSPNRVLQNNHFRWEQDRTEHFRYYFEPNSTAAEKIENTKKFLENNYGELLRLMGIEYYEPEINFFMLESRKKMSILFGYETNGKSFPEYNTTYSVMGKNTDALAMHEICHILSNNVFGNYQEAWINEGLAVYSDNNWWGYDLHRISNYLLENNKIIPFAELMNDMGSYNSLVTYPEAGSIVKYIYETYGLQSIKILWREGSESMPKATGRDLNQLESEWKAAIKKYATQNVNYEIN
ncbi:MAG: hypothetical protein GXO90_09935 [FCB group bacterium]|nr:hypothetical protein [FCB group bacterium]